jgi:hypothetical protein
VTLLARLRRAVSGGDDANVEKRLKEISDRLARLEDSLAAPTRATAGRCRRSTASRSG